MNAVTVDEAKRNHDSLIAKLFSRSEATTMKQTVVSIYPVFTALLLAGAWLMSGLFSAQASPAAMRYLSPTGTDSGDCTNPGAPCKTINYARSQSNPGDTLNLAPGTYNENDINLFIDMTIGGTGSTPAETIVDGGGVERVFAVFGGRITLNNLTIQRGDGTTQATGGGVFNNDNLVLDHVILKDNYTPGDGGGIYNAGILTVTHSIIQNNTAASVAAGLINFGTATIDHSTFSGNVNTSTTGYAGALHNNADQTMTIVNSTISGNTAATGAGLSNSGTLNLTNVTIAKNTATNDFASGVSNYGTVTFKNTIVADNTGGAQCEGTGVFTSLGYNLENTDSCNFNQGTDHPSMSASLRPLAMYGGPTPTHLLAPASAAIDTGTNSGCPADDQRGTSRPLDGDGSASAVCDIGATEFDPATDLYKTYLPLTIK